MIKRDLKEYFRLNDTPDISPSSLWGAHKTVVRGNLILLASRLKHEKQMDIVNLEKNFQSLSKTHKNNPSPTSLTLLDAAKIALNTALTCSVKKHLRWVRGRFYLQSDKFGPQLAAKLSPKHRVHTLPKIKSLNGSLTQNPKQILETFHSFYSNLYSEPQTDTTHLINPLLDNIPLPKISDQHRSIMEDPISEEEVREVIKELKRGSAPGPDGFSTQYYKIFSETLIPYLVQLFNSLNKDCPLDSTANLAYIMVIPKPGKDQCLVSNYRPISLINNDLKIMTKIISNRLGSFIGSYVHKDLVGFIPGRQGLDQIRRAIDIISLLKSGWDGNPAQEGFLLSIDLQKAFDTVTWPYLFNI